jgi:hypothetical protein
MSDQKKSSAMLPLIIVGAALFGIGAYQSTKPKDPEVNTGFVAPPHVPETSPSTPANPLTLQAPDAPPITKDAAQRAAESDAITDSKEKVKGAEVNLSLADAPWLKGLITGAFGNFRESALKSLKAEQAKGDVNCAPVLTGLDVEALAALEKVSCTAKDGSQITGEFDETGDGDLNVEDTKGNRVRVKKQDGDFNVEIRNFNN